MEIQKLSAAPRTLRGRKNYQLRQDDKIPAIVYGAELKQPKNVSVDRAALARLFKTAGESTIVELSIEGDKAVNVLIQDLQVDPMRNEIIHADFRAVDMNKPIEADVKLHFVGEAAAVKSLGGTLVMPMETLRVKALPKNLVSFIEVPLGSLNTFDDAVKIQDLVIPEGLEILADKHATVAIVSPPRSDEEMASLENAVVEDVAGIEVAKKAKAEEEEGAEGTEGAEGKAAVPEAAKKDAKGKK